MLYWAQLNVNKIHAQKAYLLRNKPSLPLLCVVLEHGEDRSVEPSGICHHLLEQRMLTDFWSVEQETQWENGWPGPREVVQTTEHENSIPE